MDYASDLEGRHALVDRLDRHLEGRYALVDRLNYHLEDHYAWEGRLNRHLVDRYALEVHLNHHLEDRYALEGRLGRHHEMDLEDRRPGKGLVDRRLGKGLVDHCEKVGLLLEVLLPLRILHHSADKLSQTPSLNRHILHRQTFPRHYLLQLVLVRYRSCLHHHLLI